VICSKIDDDTSTVHCCGCGEPMGHFHALMGSVSLVCNDCWEDEADLPDEVEFSDDDDIEFEDEEEEI